MTIKESVWKTFHTNKANAVDVECFTCDFWGKVLFKEHAGYEGSMEISERTKRIARGTAAWHEKETKGKHNIIMYHLTNKEGE